MDYNEETLEKYRATASEKENKDIDFARFNQGMEGFEMTPEGEDRCRKIFRGEVTADEAIKKILKKHGLESE